MSFLGKERHYKFSRKIINLDRSVDCLLAWLIDRLIDWLIEALFSLFSDTRLSCLQIRLLPATNARLAPREYSPRVILPHLWPTHWGKIWNRWTGAGLVSVLKQSVSFHQLEIFLLIIFSFLGGWNKYFQHNWDCFIEKGSHWISVRS
jgi:hypothetical protein